MVQADPKFQLPYRGLK